MEIRAPRLEDAEAMGRMHHASWREAYSALLPDAYWDGDGEERRIAMWRRSLTAPSPAVACRIAVHDGVIAGIAASGPPQEHEAAPAARPRELWMLYVLQQHHGSGLAHRLLEAVLPAGVPAQLWVFEANPRARAFYLKHGFVPDSARHVFGPDLGSQPEIRLVR